MYMKLPYKSIRNATHDSNDQLNNVAMIMGMQFKRITQNVAFHFSIPCSFHFRGTKYV